METKKIYIGNQVVDAIATLNSSYILNQSEPLMAVAVLKDVSVEGFSVEKGNKHIFSNFNVLLLKSTMMDEQKYEEWTDLIHRKLFKQIIPKL